MKQTACLLYHSNACRLQQKFSIHQVSKTALLLLFITQCVATVNIDG